MIRSQLDSEPALDQECSFGLRLDDMHSLSETMDRMRACMGHVPDAPVRDNDRSYVGHVPVGFALCCAEGFESVANVPNASRCFGCTCAHHMVDISQNGSRSTPNEIMFLIALGGSIETSPVGL